jgi:hypothetical protein
VRGNPTFDFLFKPQSPAGIKFEEEMGKLLKNRPSGIPQPLLPPPAPPSHYQAPVPSSIYPMNPISNQHQSQSSGSGGSGSVNAMTGDTTTRKRERKSRWGPSVPSIKSSTPCPPTVSLQAQPHVVPMAPVVTDPKLLRQLQEQKELQMLEKRIRDAAANQLKLTVSEQNQQLMQDRLSHYKELAILDNDEAPRDTIEDAEDNDGVIEDGTWEHRKRAKEMLATALKSDTSALLASGQHHISDFLPKEELDKFLKKAKGEVVSEEAYADKKLDNSNVGYQLLERGGWSEGTGLGNKSSNSSIVNPIGPQSSSGVAGAGVGVKPEHEVAEGDDEFDSYRKRMMLSYRFRPNPLNNPRRDYY